MEKFVEVYAASDITFAYLIKGQLENAEIPARIDNENVSAVYSIDGMAPRVLVPESRAEEARQIINDLQQASDQDAEDWDEEEEPDDEA